eukprot:scaffold1431_cov346-Pavlova_lutheri.AAC.26
MPSYADSCKAPCPAMTTPGADPRHHAFHPSFFWMLRMAPKTPRPPVCPSCMRVLTNQMGLVSTATQAPAA